MWFLKKTISKEIKLIFFLLNWWQKLLLNRSHYLTDWHCFNNILIHSLFLNLYRWYTSYFGTCSCIDLYIWSFTVIQLDYLYCWYTPYFGTCSRFDLYLLSFTLIQQHSWVNWIVYWGCVQFYFPTVYIKVCILIMLSYLKWLYCW